ncbi:MAG: dUTP diphosphatase [Dehalococcoidia bacterium]
MNSGGQGDEVRVKRLRARARLPTRATAGSSGFDLYACLDEPVLVGQRPVMVGTGIAVEAANGLDVQIRPRSGLAKRGILCTFGTIDADYRGELIVTMYSVAEGIEHEIRDGDRIAQIVISRLADATFAEVEDLGQSERGTFGHGSTGR